MSINALLAEKNLSSWCAFLREHRDALIHTEAHSFNAEVLARLIERMIQENEELRDRENALMCEVNQIYAYRDVLESLLMALRPLMKTTAATSQDGRLLDVINSALGILDEVERTKSGSRETDVTESPEEKLGVFVAYKRKDLRVRATVIDEEAGVQIATSRGTLYGRQGDYLIVDESGQRYTCAKDVFEAEYERA